MVLKAAIDGFWVCLYEICSRQRDKIPAATLLAHYIFLNEGLGDKESVLDY